MQKEIHIFAYSSVHERSCACRALRRCLYTMCLCWGGKLDASGALLIVTCGHVSKLGVLQCVIRTKSSTEGDDSENFASSSFPIQTHTAMSQLKVACLGGLRGGAGDLQWQRWRRAPGRHDHHKGCTMLSFEIMVVILRSHSRGTGYYVAYVLAKAQVKPR